VLVGHEGDTLDLARERLEWVFEAGGTPFAMYYRPGDDQRFKIPSAWGRFVRAWSRPAMIFSNSARNAGALAGDTPERAEPGRVLEVV
jgi:hypothetical protein